MANKSNQNPELIKAAAKLGKYLGASAATAASTTVSLLLTIFNSAMVPVLSLLLTELLSKKDAKKKYGKFLRPARDVLNGANLDEPQV